MDSLNNIIKNLKKEEIRNFKIFTNRFQRSEEVKIATLFDLIRSGKYDNDDGKLVAHLFPDDPENMNAYYRLKNRLKTELEKSLLNLHHNLDEKITIFNFITLSSIFSYKSQYELSLYYLKKAERSAQKNEFYDLLDLVYNELVNLSHNYYEIDPQEYIDKRKENSEKRQVLMQANHAIATVSAKLRKTNFSNKANDIDDTLQKILDELQIANEIYNIPRVKFMIHYCIRDSLLQSRDFVQLEKYMKQTLHDFEKQNLFSKSNHTLKIKDITWVINTLTINRKWGEAINYIEKLHEELHKYNRLNYDNYIWTYYQALITNYMSSGELQKAIELLEQIKELPAHKGVYFYEYAIHVNLALCYYFSNNKTAAIRTLSHLLTKDIYPKLSTELQLSISMVELILHYDNTNYDHVSYRIGEIKRQFRTQLKKDEFSEEKQFLKILQGMCNKPDPLNDKQIRTQINSFIGRSPGLQVGSSKHIDFSIWFRSKLEKRPYYNVLLESLQAPAA